MALTTTIGIPYPVAADNNNPPADFLAMATWLDPVIEGSYTTAEIAAFSATQKWPGRRVHNSTKGCYQRYDGTNFVDEQAVEINAQVGTTYTLVLADANSKLVKLTNAAAIALTIPTNATVAFPIGTVINLVQYGAGQVTVGGAGVTINSAQGLKLRAQYSSGTLIKMGTDEWLLSGDTTT